MLANCNSLLAIAEWGRDEGAPVARRLGFTRDQTPCVATLHRVLRRVDVAAFEQAVGSWVATVQEALDDARAAGPDPPDAAAADVALAALAVDGKVLRASRRVGVPAAHQLCALSQPLGLVVGQCPVGRRGEAAALADLVADLVLEGRVVTLDAAFTDPDLAVLIREKGGTI
jgi:AcrR family transcriptional regulator